MLTRPIKALLCLYLLLAGHSSAQALHVETLQQLAWHYRLLLLNGDALQQDDLHALSAQSQALNERQIMWFWQQQNHIKSNLAHSLSPQSTQQISQYLQDVNVVLIGKDGTIKDKAHAFDLDSLILTIDKMPMRRQEMHNQTISH